MTDLLHAASRRPWWTLWIVATIFWTLSGVATATNYHLMAVRTGYPSRQLIIVALVSAWMSVPVTVFASWIAYRLPFGRHVWARRSAQYVAVGLLVCVARAAAVAALNPWVHWYDQVPPVGQLLLTSVANNLFFFLILIAVAHAWIYARQAQHHEAERVKSELYALRLQLHPHFLFNALNTASSYVHEHPQTAQRVLNRLSALLRHALAMKNSEELSVDEELTLLQSYLDIELVRFGDRLRIEWQIEPQVREALIPNLLLQPIVENAVRHGIAPRSGPGTIHIAAKRHGPGIRITVADDGIGLNPGWMDQGGLGLENTRARLRHQYGDSHHFSVAAREGGGTIIEIDLPMRVAVLPGEQETDQANRLTSLVSSAEWSR